MTPPDEPTGRTPALGRAWRPRPLALVLGLALLTALPLAQALGLGWYLHLWLKAAPIPGGAQGLEPRFAHMAYGVLACSATAVASLAGGWLILKGRVLGLRLGKLTFLALMADTLFKPLLVYLLPYPPPVKAAILESMGGLVSAGLFAKAAAWGACLAALCLVRPEGPGNAPGPARHA